MTKSITFLGNLIGGRFIFPPRGAHKRCSENPGDLANPVGTWCFSDKAVEGAVDAARAAQPAWAELGFKKRAKALKALARLLRSDKQALASVITREMGKTIRESTDEVDRIVSRISQTLTEDPILLAPRSVKMSRGIKGVLRRRPRGVIAVLSPFNVPAYLAMSQTLTAIYAGNTVVLKPSDLVPFTIQRLAVLLKKAGLPPGVVNIVHGDASCGERLVSHPCINGIFFTGSWSTGSAIQKALLEEPQKIVALEMGGKNAAVILEDADIEEAVRACLTGAYLTTGQRCNATSRIILHRKIAKKFIRLFLKAVDSIRIGYGLDRNTFMGPLASEGGFDRFVECLPLAPLEGYKTLRRAEPFGAKRRGYYTKPSVHLREGLPRFAVEEQNYTDREILGPDTAMTVVKNIDEALHLNNRPRYGLVTSVFTRSRRRFEFVLQKAESGLINWNTATVRSSSKLPFGGLKQSGNHRPMGSLTPYLATLPTTSIEKVR